jgi:hypothetical protein
MIGEIIETLKQMLGFLATALKPLIDVGWVIWSHIWNFLMAVPKEILIIFGLITFGFTMYQFYEHLGTSWLTSLFVTIIFFIIALSTVGWLTGVDIWGFVTGVLK